MITVTHPSPRAILYHRNTFLKSNFGTPQFFFEPLKVQPRRRLDVSPTALDPLWLHPTAFLHSPGTTRSERSVSTWPRHRDSAHVRSIRDVSGLVTLLLNRCKTCARLDRSSASIHRSLRRFFHRIRSEE